MGCRLRQPESEGGGLTGSESQAVVDGSLGALARRVDAVATAVHHVVVDAVLGKGCGRGRAEEARAVGLVLDEEEFGPAFGHELVVTECPVMRVDCRHPFDAVVGAQPGLGCAYVPAPRI